MSQQIPKTIIGRAEKVIFPELGDAVLHARIDTGARTSSIHVESIEETEHGLETVFADDENRPDSKMIFRHYERVVVASSMGHRQVRYMVKLSMIMRKRRIKTSFTLTDRSEQVYPVLIGRRALNRKFIVDVSIGSPLKEKEDEHSNKLQSAIVSEEKI